MDPPDSESLTYIRLGVNKDGVLSLEGSLSVSISSLNDVGDIVLTERSSNDLILGYVVGLQVLSGKSLPLSTSLMVVVVSINMPVTSWANGISHGVVESIWVIIIDLGVLGDLMLGVGDGATGSNGIS